MGLSYVTTDRHAALATAEFAGGRASLSRVDWDLLRRSDFTRSEVDPAKLERYQAEALLHRHLPLAGVDGFAVRDQHAKDRLESVLRDRGASIKLVVRRTWFLQ